MYMCIQAEMGSIERLLGYRMALNGMPASKLTGTYLKARMCSDALHHCMPDMTMRPYSGIGVAMRGMPAGKPAGAREPPIALSKCVCYHWGECQTLSQVVVIIFLSL